jgi:hypothetical protein
MSRLPLRFNKTAAGQAIGIGTHTLHSPDSEIGHTIVGFFNAMSPEFLLYPALIELLLEDFLSRKSWYEMRGRNRVAACILVFVGAFWIHVTVMNTVKT